MQEYPKCLYKDGELGKETAIATDAAHEAALNKEGFFAVGAKDKKTK
jgi:hypothetical protein